MNRDMISVEAGDEIGRASTLTLKRKITNLPVPRDGKLKGIVSRRHPEVACKIGVKRMLTAVLSGFVLSLVAPWLQRIARGATGWILALLPLGLFIYFASFVSAIAGGQVFTVSYPWVPSLGVNLSFYLDGLSLTFALLISGVGALVVIYAGGYLAGDRRLGRLYLLLLMFMASMLGLALTGDLITLFIFWELTSVSSYLLIGFDHEREEARAAALQALLVTNLGGLALLAGLVTLGLAGGSYEFSTLLGQGEVIRSHPLYLPTLLLVLLGAFTKSAQFPFHFWLPGAMEAPAPVSAYLHSATMVKAGVYLLARLTPVLGGAYEWHYIVMITGSVTMIVGAAMALAQTDLKRLLAYSTVSALGALTLLIGLGTTPAIKAAMVYLLVHSLYKGALFLVTGSLDHEAGTRDVERLGGLRRAMPVTAAAAVLAALSMAGLPPLFGFVSKELLYEANLQAPQAAWLITGAGVLANVIMFSLAAVIALRPFFGRERETPKEPHEAPPAMLLGPGLLALMGLVIGLAPDTLAAPLVAAAVSAARAEPTEIKLALWHGLNPILILSAATVAGGACLYLLRGRLYWLNRRLRIAAEYGPARWYKLALDGLMALAKAQTRVLQNGYLRVYLLVVISTTLGLAGYALFSRVELALPVTTLDARSYEWIVAAVILGATIATAQSLSRLTAVATLGVVGFGIALIYILYGAPDLAKTQFAIETLTVALFVLALYRLPRFGDYTGKSARARDLIVALATGGFMTTLLLAVVAIQRDSRLAGYFAENSARLAKGRNIVNVILVDFRALDTLGEITVLSVAAVGVFALLRLRLGGAVGGAGFRRPAYFREGEKPVRPLILSTAARLLMPLMLLFSLFLLLRGHNEPGGGFIGGLVAATAFMLYALAYDVAHARKTLRVDPHALIAAGLLVALVSGLIPVVIGKPFLTGLWIGRELPVLGKAGTPLMFDTGVYLVVFGVTLMILFTLAEQPEE